MHEDGCVDRTEGEVAVVRVLRGTACDECHASGACKTLGGGRDMEVEAANPLGAKTGDRVRVQIPSKSVARMAFMVYIIPVLAMLAGALLGFEMGDQLAMNPEVTALGGSLLGFGLAFLVVRKIGQALAHRKDYTPQISKILS